MICPNCKRPIPDGSPNCPYCGVPVYGMPPANQQPQQPQYQQPQYQQPRQPQYQQPVYQQPQQQQPMQASYPAYATTPKKGGTSAFVFSIIFMFMMLSKFVLFTVIGNKGHIRYNDIKGLFTLSVIIDTIIVLCLIMVPFAVKNRTFKIISFILLGVAIPLFIMSDIALLKNILD